MKSYDELKAEMEAIQQQMVEAKKNEQTSHLFVHNHRYQINKTTEKNAENTPKVHGFSCLTV